MEDVLEEIIPSQHRKTVYVVFALIGVTLGAIQVGYNAADLGNPVWVTVATAVYTFVGGAVGFTALANTKREPYPSDPDALGR